MSTSKLLLIGIDAATFDVIDALVSRGKLPTLAHLMRTGVSGELRSTIPPMSPVAWSSLITGMNPGKHGIFNFTRPRANTYDIEFVNGGMRKAPALWSILSSNGRQVGVINVPMSFPPERVNGFLISGMDAPGPDSQFTYPPSLREEIRKQVGGYDIDYLFSGMSTEGNEPEILSGLRRMANQRAATARYLMRTWNWDFFMPVFIVIDRVQHHFWHYSDPSHSAHRPDLIDKYGSVVHDMYELIDSHISGLLDLMPDDGLVMIVSDHGFGPNDKSVPFLDMKEWLRSEGLLSLISIGRSGIGLKNLFQRWSTSSLRAIKAALRRHLSSNLRTVLKTRLPRLHETVDSRIFILGIDWARTKVYPTYDELVSHGLRINLLGREPQGTVRPGRDYEALRQFLVKRIESLRRPDTGEKVVRGVHLREVLYPGPYTDDAPDLVIEWGDEAYSSGAGSSFSAAETAQSGGTASS
ncbi:MAG: alkaline phosphatase family protein, partial [Anaerolineales bacterium]